MEKKKLLFVINQFFKGGAETALLNLLLVLPQEQFEVDLLIFDQIKLSDTIPLIPQIPNWVNVIDTAEKEGQLAFVKKAIFKACRKLSHRQLFRRAAIRSVQEKRYDAAISYGEWFSSRLVAEYVQARRKYVWIHADMDKAAFVHPDILKYQQCFDRFLFASERSMAGAEQQYPQLNGRGQVVHNMVDEPRLRELSRQPVPEWFPSNGLPVLLTVANIREEKNHLRQVEVMKRLFQEGWRFYWINLGTQANRELVGRVKEAVRAAGLEDYFLLPGAVSNPYPVMGQAKAVCVLSDHESWSMVITEAKTLGIPVIATRTSGALEQLKDGKTGILCDFSAEDIAKKIEMLLDQPELGAAIQKNLSCFSACTDTMVQLEPLLMEERKKLAYLFDDVNYISGARNAALLQMEYLSTQAQVDLFSGQRCQDRQLRNQYRTLDLEDSRGLRCLSTPCGDVLREEEYSWKWKCLRLVYALTARLGQEQILPQLFLNGALKRLLNSYDVVCVVSEASKLRGAVSKLDGPKKIQWIHTDYAAWRTQSVWTRAVTKQDKNIYRYFDTIVCLSPRLRDRFVEIYPQFAEKIAVIPNLIDVERIQEMSMEPSEVQVDQEKLNLITVGRMEKEKRYDLILQAAKLMKERGTKFHWYLVGGGPLLEELQTISHRQNIDQDVTFTGELKNPYPLMKQCNALVLMSDYEGTPVTIDEAKVLGLPVVSRDVGGVRDQLEGGYGDVVQGRCFELERIVEHSAAQSRIVYKKIAEQQKIVEQQLEMLFEL